MSRRVVITGIGVVAPNGIGTDAYWRATLEGRSGISRISRFDPSRYATQVAGQVPDFTATDYIDQRLIVQTDRWTHLALAATKLALDDAGLDPAAKNPYKVSVITASSSGGNEFGQREIHSLWSKGPLFVGAYQSIAWFYAASSGQISIKHGTKGASSVVVSEGAGGLDALALARRTIRRGVEAVICGGTEASISPYALVCQTRNGRLSSATEPDQAYRPFDARANGYVPGEGGAILIVEDLEAALQRGAPRVYGEIVGYAATNDAYHPSKLAPDGRQFTRAIELALANAELRPEDIDVIFADAAGTPDGDALEAQAIRQVFGRRAAEVPVTAPKTMVGRLYGGGAALDAATALLAMRSGRVPPTINVDRPAPGCELNLVVGQSLARDVRTVLVNARGFGGFNSAMVLRKYDA